MIDFGHDGPAGFNGQYGGGTYSYSTGFDADDIFSSFFKGFGFDFGTGKQSGPKKGVDLNYNLEITFEEAYLGVKKEITINRNEQCSNCHGTKAKPGTHAETCTMCGGSGQIKQVVTTMFGQMQTSKVCSNCKGEGKIVREPCPECRGKRKSKKTSKNICKHTRRNK